LKTYVVKLHGLLHPFHIDAESIQVASKKVREQHPGQAFIIREDRT